MYFVNNKMIIADDKLLEEHLPFNYDDTQMNDEGLQLLVQDGFVIRYSDKRKTPLFTSQKLEGTVLRQVEDEVNIFIKILVQIM